MQNNIDFDGFIQVALVVKDIEKAAETWAKFFNVPKPEIKVDPPADNPDLTYRGKPAYYGLKLAVIQAEGAEALVVGMPKTADGQDTEIIRQIRNFTASLRRRIDLPVYCMEETLSSFEAEQKLRDVKKNRAGLDGAAAAGILESFLNIPENKRITV